MSAKPTISFGQLGWLEKTNLSVLGLGVLALTARLWPEWKNNPDLSHGFFMPLVFAALIWESRERGPYRFLPSRPLTYVAFGAALACGLLALIAAGLYAASVDWSHPLVSLTLTASLAAMLAATLIAYSTTNVRFLAFNWTACTGVGLWLLTAPIPPGTYTRLTLGLQLWVSENVLRALHLFGIPALRHGNIIELANTAVGVEEACSGVRSLISCVFAGLFFSATLVRRPLARALIIGLSAPLALGMNFVRSLTLTLLSNAGIDIRGAWHDWTGFAVLGVTAVILGGLALLLEQRGAPPRPVPARNNPIPQPGPMRVLGATLAVVTLLTGFFIFNTRQPVRHDAPEPNLAALIPPAADGWQVRTSDLYQFTGTLHTNTLVQRQYVRGPQSNPLDVTLYVAYWRPGQAPVSLVASHTPDACLPGSGWTSLPTPEVRTQLVVDHRQVPEAEVRLFKSGDYPQYVWFWHLYDGRPILYRDPYSPLELLRIAWRYGFRHDGDQMFIRVSSNRPWPQIKDEPLVQEFFARLKAFGL